MYIIVFKDSKGWRWALRSGESKPIATALKPYRSKRDVLDFLDLLIYPEACSIYDVDRKAWIRNLHTPEA